MKTTDVSSPRSNGGLDPVGRREPEMCVAGNSGAFVRGYFGCGVSLPSGGAYLRRGAVGEHAYGGRGAIHLVAAEVS